MFRPLRDYLLVRPVERVKSDVLTVVSDEKPNLGIVEAVGPGKLVKGKRKPLGVRIGDHVRFGTAEGYLNYPKIKQGEKEFLLLQEADICWVQ